MNDLYACPGCGGTALHAFAITPVEERADVIHFAQTRCRGCDLVFSNPVADPAELERYYRSEYYEEEGRIYSADQPDMTAIMAAWEREEAAGLRDSVLPYVASGAFFEIGVVPLERMAVVMTQQREPDGARVGDLQQVAHEHEVAE